MHYSLKKRLIWGTSIFSVILGCILIFSAYKVALQEVDEILDTQMKYLAERTAEHPLKTVSSKFDFHKTYHEEDLFIDIWAYKDQAICLIIYICWFHLLSKRDFILIKPLKV